MEKGYKNLGMLLLVLVPITIIGFLKTYLSQFPNFEKDPGITIHFHFVVSALWIILFIAQPMLIKAKKYYYHRLLGKFSYVLFILILISFIPIFLKQIQYNYLPLTILTTSDIISVILFYALAIYYKQKVQLHMRYMIVLTLVFIFPAIGRIFIHWLDFSFMQNMSAGFVLKSILLLGLITKDKRNSKNYIPYVIGILFFTIRQAAILLAFYKII
ncbi:hypothetical protein [Aquimarina megaterium]|uniref:hypothetical protein n=1 Tax=Aquimarina megaterium TaxID=1443666 RepID=UPI00047166E2|nr:hypothetical protein [Aquimarina megaterium]